MVIRTSHRLLNFPLSFLITVGSLFFSKDVMAEGQNADDASGDLFRWDYTFYTFEQYGTKSAKIHDIKETQLNRYSFGIFEVRPSYELKDYQFSLGIKASRYFSDEALEYADISLLTYRVARLKRGYQALAANPAFSISLTDSMQLSLKTEYERREAIEPIRGVASDRTVLEAYLGSEDKAGKWGIGGLRVKETTFRSVAPFYEEETLTGLAERNWSGIQHRIDLRVSKIRRDEELDFQDADYREHSGIYKLSLSDEPITPEVVTEIIHRQLALKQLEDFNFAQAEKFGLALMAAPKNYDFTASLGWQHKVFRKLNKIYTIDNQNLFLYADGSSESALAILTYSPAPWIFLRYKGQYELFHFSRVHPSEHQHLRALILPSRFVVQSLFVEISQSF
jgi:hypothetical protein